jgi:uncharacterized protein (TIGR02453 family)
VAFEGFSRDFFKFFRDLKKHNERAWFEAEKERFRSVVQAQLSDFITALAPHLAKVSPHFRADPRPSGGSMFRIHRDVRFAKDKSPYKTHAAAQFRHDSGKDVHAPGYYLHLAPGQVFFGGGMWMPEPPTLLLVRTRIAERSSDWKKVQAAILKPFGGLSHDDEKLSRPPKGFDAEHPLIEDIKRKSFFVGMQSDEAAAGSPAFVRTVAKAYADAAPLMRFLCAAAGVKF